MAIRHETVEREVDPTVDRSRLESGRARIVSFKTAKDGRRYATAVGTDGRTVVVWGSRDSSIEELCLKADAKLPPLPVSAAEPTAAEAQQAGLVEPIAAAEPTEPAVETEPVELAELPEQSEIEETVPAPPGATRPSPDRRWPATAGAAALAVACCLLAVLGAGLLAGYRPVVLTTASMSPVAPAGSLLIAETVEPEEVEVGDILVMKRSTGLIITHRVVERSVRDGVVLVRTKGDANDDPDATPYSVVGTHRRSEWVIPSAGKVLLLLRTKVFRLCIIAILASLIVYIGTTELRRLLRPQPLAALGNHQPSQAK
jgi:signal peptidase